MMILELSIILTIFENVCKEVLTIILTKETNLLEQ